MSLWASIDIEVITKAILYLLRSQFLRANDYDDMRRVFLEEPCKLYTSDIQSAFMHLTSGGRETDVPALNRRNNEQPEILEDNRNGETYKKYLNPSYGTQKKQALEPIAFKNFKLTLVVPKKVNLMNPGEIKTNVFTRPKTPKIVTTF